MVKEIHVQGLEAYKKAVDENKGKTIFALFSGSTDANGKSWCPDCVTGKSGLKYLIVYSPRWQTIIDVINI